jgi:hypothetical protein
MGASEDFVAWCESHGCELAGVELRDAAASSSPTAPVVEDSDGGDDSAAVGAADAAAKGRGVFARVDFKRGERVLSVPYSACIGTSEIRCGAGRGSQPPFPGATPAECLAWNVLSVRGHRGWAPYVAALPVAIDSPTAGAWDRKEIAELQIGDAVGAAAIALAKDAKAARTLAEVAGAGGAGGAGGEVKRKGEAVDDDGEGEGGVAAGFAKEWAWALSCVRSRAIELEGARQSLLVPFVDMLNHVHENPHVTWSSAAAASSASGDGGGDEAAAGSGCVVLTAERDIRAGEEVTITYAAEAPSDSFALYMGFLGGHNAHDSVQLFPSLRAAAVWYAASFKSEAGEEVVDMGVAQGVADAFAERAGPGEAAPRLGWGGRVSDALVDMLEHFNRQIMSEQDPSQLAAHAVKLRCQEMLLGFPTTAEQDMELLEAEEGSDRFKLAVEFRLRKKAILRHMLS